MAKRKSDHYINNQEFFVAMKDWKVLVDVADKAGEKHPPITEYIGTCFMKIAEHLSRKPNFMNYPYRDEMQSDGVENCLLYAYNFDPEKSTNPFSYFTQIIYYAFLRRIQKEKKQAYIKLKKIEDSDVDSGTRRWFRENFLKPGGYETVPTFLTENDIVSFEKKEEVKLEKSEEKTKAKTKTATKKIKPKGKKE